MISSPTSQLIRPRWSNVVTTPKPGKGDLIVASNASFAHHKGESDTLEPMSGGLVQSMIYGMLREAQLGRRVVGIALPKTPGDWRKALTGELTPYYGEGYIEPLNTEPVWLGFVDVDPHDMGLHYHVWANEYKWLGEHGLPGTLELAEAHEARDASLRVQSAMADMILSISPEDPKKSVVLLQDYQIEEIAQFLPGRRATRFHHIPVNTREQWIERGNDPALVDERIVASSGVSTGVHDPVYADNFRSNLLAAGVPEAELPYIHSVSVQINPDAMHAAALTESARAGRDVLRHRFAETPAVIAAERAGYLKDGFLPDKHGFVGRLDPKNGLPPLLLSYLAELNDPELVVKPLLGIVCDRARERNATEVPLERMHEREDFAIQILANEIRSNQTIEAMRKQDSHWLENAFDRAIAAYQDPHTSHPLPAPNVYDREFVMSKAVLKVIEEHPQHGLVMLTSKDDKVLEAEIDFMWVPTLRSGRDFVNLQASVRREPGDAPVVMFSSENAPGHKTVQGFYASQTVELEWQGHHLPALGHSDEFVEGAVIIRGLQPASPTLENALVLHGYWSTAHEMGPKEREQRWQQQLRGVIGDNQDVQIAFQEAAARGDVLGTGHIKPGHTEVDSGPWMVELPHSSFTGLDL